MMNIKQFYTVPQHPAFASAALLLLRGVTGVAFMMHGWSKIQHPFDWMGADAFAPGFLQALAALSEFGGGAAWVLGLLTPLASLGIACTMMVATYMHGVMRGDPFVSMTGGATYELPLIFLCIAVLFIAMGPGKFSLDHKLFGSRSSTN